MDKNETELDEVIDTEMETDVDEVEETEDDIDPDADTDVEDTEDEFEYDENGDIIIPEEEESEGEEDGAVEDEGETEKPEESGDEGVAEPKNTAPKSDEVATLRKRLQDLEAQTRDTLQKMGVKDEDIMEGLATLAAEAEDIPLEEYKKQMAERQRKEQADRLLRHQEFERLAAADLAILHAEFPETLVYKHIAELPADIRTKFGQFRDLGLSAKEAYSAANPDGIRTSVASATKKQGLHESKSHLKSAVPKGSKDHSVTMTKAELSQWRDMFPDLSDKEIQSLYKRTAK